MGQNFRELSKMPLSKNLNLSVPQFPMSEFVESSKNIMHIGYVKWYNNARLLLNDTYT